MVTCTDRQVVMDSSNVGALDAAICLFFAVLGGSDGQERFLSLQVCCGQATSTGRKSSLGSHAEHFRDTVLPSAGLVRSSTTCCGTVMF